MKDKANAVKENIKDMPTQTAYAVYSAKEKAKSSVSDFKRGMVQEQQSRQTGRLESRNSIDKISLTSVWSFKRHKKQGRHSERLTDQRQRELPVPMSDQPQLQPFQSRVLKNAGSQTSCHSDHFKSKRASQDKCYQRASIIFWCF